MIDIIMINIWSDKLEMISITKFSILEDLVVNGCVTEWVSLACHR